MSPRSLLFSSDEGTSQLLTRALNELELDVEPCSEIFTAVERLTNRTFDVLVADWDAGPEASFLLKTSRELKSTRIAFALAIAGPQAIVDSQGCDADLLLRKPLTCNEIKYALLTCDQFLCCMRAWLGKQERAGTTVSPVCAVVQEAPFLSPAPSKPETLPQLPTWSADTGSLAGSFGEDPQPTRQQPAMVKVRDQSRGNKILWGAALAVALSSVGYVFSQPLRGEAAVAGVATVYARAEAWLHKAPLQSSPPNSMQSANVGAQNTSSDASLAVRVVPIHHTPPPVTNTVLPVPQSKPADTGQVEDSEHSSIISSVRRIPESLNLAIPGSASFRTAASHARSLLDAVEPVSLKEDMSQELLLQKVQPSYPEQALKAGLQGPVVLQAWIATDGTIRELKLIRGSLVLGRAAYAAVKQWRYKPYLLNGRAVEAETYVTVDFKLP